MGSLTAKRNMKKKELNEVSLGEPIHYGMDVYGDGIPDDFWSDFLCYDGTAFSIKNFKGPNGVRYIVKAEYPKLSEVLADEKMTREVLSTCDYYNLEKDQPEQINYGDIMRTFPNIEAITLEEYENLRAIIDGRPPKNQSSNKQPTKGSLKDFMKKKELNEEIGNDSKVTWADFDVLSPKIFRDGGSYYHTYYWECYDGVAFGFKREPDDNGPEYLKMTYPKLAEVLSDEEMKKNVLNVHYENYDDMDEDKVDYADVMIALWDPKNIEISNGEEMKNRKKVSLGYVPQKGSLRDFLKKKELNEETSNYETEVGFVDKRFFGNSKPRVYDVICYDGHATGQFNLEATEGSNSYTGGYENSPKEITITYPKLSEISADEELNKRIREFMTERYGDEWARTDGITYGDAMYCFGKIDGDNLNRPESGSLRKFLKKKLDENSLKRGLKSEMQCYRDYSEVQRMFNGKTLEEVKEILKNGNFMLCNQFNEYDINEKRTIVIDANYKSITFTVKIDPDTNFAKVTPDFECYDENDQYIGVRRVDESSLKGGLRKKVEYVNEALNETERSWEEQEKQFLSTFTKEDAWDIIMDRTKMNFSPGEYICNFTSPKLCITSEELNKLRDRYDFDRRAYILTANKDFCDGHFRVQVTYNGRSNNAHYRETIRKEDNDFHFNMNRSNDYWGWIMVDADMLRRIRNRNSLFGA